VWMGVALLSAGAAVGMARPGMLVGAQQETSAAVGILAGYFVARNLGLAVMLLVAMSLRARGMLNGLLLLTGLVQILDVAMDCVEGRWAVVPGVLVLGILFFCAAAGISGRPFWRMGAWRGESRRS